MRPCKTFVEGTMEAKTALSAMLNLGGESTGTFTVQGESGIFDGWALIRGALSSRGSTHLPKGFFEVSQLLLL